MVKNLYVLLMLAGPIFLGYAMQVMQGQWTVSPLDGYLVFYALSLALAMFILGQKVDIKSVRKNLQWRKSFDRVSSHAFRIILILSVVFFIFWARVLWAKYVSFSLNFFDSGIYSDIAFNSSQGRILFSSQHNMNALGEHFSPIMLAFVPLFWISPNVLWLLMAQVAAFAICPVFLFFYLQGGYKKCKAGRTGRYGIMICISYPPQFCRNRVSSFHPFATLHFARFFDAHQKSFTNILGNHGGLIIIQGKLVLDMGFLWFVFLICFKTQNLRDNTDTAWRVLGNRCRQVGNSLFQGRGMASY